jgi:ribonuclease HI
LLNTSLTTVCGQTDAHKTAWTPFISCILSEMARRDIPIVALGAKATQLAKLTYGAAATQFGTNYGADHSSLIFSCGHPSPLALGAKFADVTVFNDVNRWLVEHYRTPVNWGNCAAAEPVVVPMATSLATQSPVSVISRDPAPDDHVELLEGAGGDEIVYAFTDGACEANGRKGARATYAAHIVTSISITDVVGIVAPAPNSPPTNNRGELSGILVALEILRDYVDAYPEMRIVSDSEYAINAITTWYPKWIAKNKTADKCNLELIGQCNALYNKIKQEANIKFLHIRSHQPEPTHGTLAWFMWNGNNCADLLCTRANARP